MRARRHLPYLAAALTLSMGCSLCPRGTHEPDDPRRWALPVAVGRDWRRTGPVREFIPSDLYKHNNGAAAAYIDYGFVKLRTAQYAKGGTRMTVDVFDMGQAKNAFGMYSSMRSLDDTFVEVGNQGMTFDGVLDFWQGRYLAHVAPATADPVPEALSLELGRAIAECLGDWDAIVPELDLFPKDGLVPNSITYYRQKALGHGALKNAFVAQYRVKGKEAHALLAGYADEQEARAALGSFMGFLRKKGRVGPLTTTRARHVLEGSHPYFGELLFVAEGTRLAGTFGQASSSLVDELLRSGK